MRRGGARRRFRKSEDEGARALGCDFRFFAISQPPILSCAGLHAGR
jgi:hypothetical protein